jgi:CheY-like chemotaxis protein
MKKENVCLLIDDDLDDQEIFALALEQVANNWICLVASSGLEAIRQLNDRSRVAPSYIFLDLNMPKMNGKECLKEIKKIQHLKNIPVVIYSTSSFRHDIIEAKNLGATDFITKPFTMHELIDVLDNFFGKHSIKEQIC